MKVVSNATPLIGLASIERFEILKRLFKKIYIAEAVYEEVVVNGHEQGSAKQVVQAAAWIEVVSVANRLAVDVLLEDIDLGEAETIILAKEMQADWVLMDEKKGRRKLAQLNLNKIGTVGILLKAKQLGLLSAIRPEIERLQHNGFSLGQAVIDIILKAAEET